MEAIKLCRLDTPIIFIEARINLSRFVVTGCAAKTSATVTFPSLNLISLFAFCFNIWLKDRKSGSAGMPRPISYAVFCLKHKRGAGLAAREDPRRAEDRAREGES